MKKFILILAVILAVFVFAGCASITQRWNFASTGTVVIDKRGEETSTVWLGFFGKENYPSAEKVAQDNGITRIATIERYYKIGVFGLWVDYTTIVTGE